MCTRMALSHLSMHMATRMLMRPSAPDPGPSADPVADPAQSPTVSLGLRKALDICAIPAGFVSALQHSGLSKQLELRQVLCARKSASGVTRTLLARARKRRRAPPEWPDQVVVKFTRATGAASELARREIDFGYFVRELPNVARIVAHAEHGLVTMMCVEYISGGDAFERVKRAQARHKDSYVAASERRWRDTARDLLRAVAAMHAVKIAHRDIKPENLLVHARSRAGALADFAFALDIVADSASERARACGSPFYLSPDMADVLTNLSEAERKQAFADADPAAWPWCPLANDVWACGVTLYALLHGTMPFNYARYAVDGRMFVKQLALAHARESLETDALLSPEAADLLRRLLDTRESTRISAAGALDHPWLRETSRSAPHIGPSSVISATSLHRAAVSSVALSPSRARANLLE